ncbi:MAG: CDP-diglyceride synthetase [Acidobacteria bacterium]|nr:CDP-diglyceride synthetase [Acidobacteriota bacterium]
MLRRILSALVLIPAALAAVVFSPPLLFLAALGFVGSLCLFEYYRLIEKIGVRGQPWFGHAAFWLLLIGVGRAEAYAVPLIAGLVLGAFLAAIWRPASMKDRVLGMMSNLLGVFYLGVCLYAAYAIRFRFGSRPGLEWMLVLLAVIWAGDTAALFVGRAFGRTPFASKLSPKKTYEGAVGGLLAGLLVAMLLRHFLFPDLPPGHVAAASVVAGIFGQLGDLAESLFKRAAEVKESSNLIPGHGGVLDRIDSLLFAFPVLYIYLELLYATPR